MEQPRMMERFTPNFSDNNPPTNMKIPSMIILAAVTKIKSLYSRLGLCLKKGNDFVNLFTNATDPLLLIYDVT